MAKFARVDVVKKSFLYCVIPKWNNLPEHVVEQTNSDTFNLFVFLREYICIDNFIVILAVD